jgi:hypothetical protein
MTKTPKQIVSDFYTNRDILAEALHTVHGTHLRDLLAAQQHAIWSRWMKYLFQKGVKYDDGSFLIAADSVQRWTRQMETEYAALPDSEKKSDLDIADEILALIHNKKDLAPTAPFTEKPPHPAVMALLDAEVATEMVADALKVIDDEIKDAERAKRSNTEALDGCRAAMQRILTEPPTPHTLDKLSDLSRLLTLAQEYNRAAFIAHDRRRWLLKLRKKLIPDTP